MASKVTDMVYKAMATKRYLETVKLYRIKPMTWGRPRRMGYKIVGHSTGIHIGGHFETVEAAMLWLELQWKNKRRRYDL